ncbi:winged helix-turn-helix transcriptional regulator [Nocardia nova]|uniref:winged helix-turn-helix transcriptional regulator n=1 Tax=Nocardia nova TaxID=37330 RepID=UPI0021570825|nr:helix-turn-helix domain-containing protein [Nocardia nova]
MIRELCSGPRRYSDLFADLPGISTDILAARLKDLERDGILTHRKVGSRSAAAVYELTPAGTVTVHIGDTAPHYVIGAAGISHHEGPAPAADHEFRLDLAEATEIATGTRRFADVVAEPGRGARS